MQKFAHPAQNLMAHSCSFTIKKSSPYNPLSFLQKYVNIWFLGTISWSFLKLFKSYEGVNFWRILAINILLSKDWLSEQRSAARARLSGYRHFVYEHGEVPWGSGFRGMQRLQVSDWSMNRSWHKDNSQHVCKFSTTPLRLNKRLLSWRRSSWETSSILTTCILYLASLQNEARGNYYHN